MYTFQIVAFQKGEITTPLSRQLPTYHLHDVNTIVSVVTVIKHRVQVCDQLLAYFC